MIDDLRMLRSLLLDIVYPPLCIGCRQLGGYLCPDCIDKIHVYTTPLCPGCMRPIARLGVHQECQGHTQVDGLCVVARHDGVLQQLISKMKYEGLFDLVPTVGWLIASACGDEFSEATVITSVPLHMHRLRERGYNQSALIARNVAQRLGIRYRELLQKTRQTAPQVQSSRKERFAHIHGVFSSNGTNIVGETVVIIDDVVTTGATLQECAGVLRKMGAKRVIGATLSHGK